MTTTEQKTTAEEQEQVKKYKKSRRRRLLELLLLLLVLFFAGIIIFVFYQQSRPEKPQVKEPVRTEAPVRQEAQKPETPSVEQKKPETEKKVEGVEVEIDLSRGKIYFRDLAKGFESGRINHLMVVSEKTGWWPVTEQGVKLQQEEDGSYSFPLEEVLFSQGTTRFNLVNLHTQSRVMELTEKEGEWFQVSALENLQELKKTTVAPDFPPADGDIVMSLKDGGKTFSGETVPYRN